MSERPTDVLKLDPSTTNLTSIQTTCLILFTVARERPPRDLGLHLSIFTY
jgi:hypothetical protein